VKSQIFKAAVTFVMILLTAACAKTHYPYAPKAEMPRMIYVDKDLQNLKTDDGKLTGQRVYVAVTTKEGTMETGKLVRITELDLVMIPEYYYESVNDSVFKYEPEKVIPKDEILILKVY